MSSIFDDPGYDPRRGAVLGRVRKKDFSIDGKSWDYRDPYNQEQLLRQNRGGSVSEDERITVNEHSLSLTNPLYDYDYGTVRDAAKTLEIGNVDEKDEVDRILDYIRTGKSPSEDEEENNYEPTPLPEDPYAGDGNEPSPTFESSMPRPGDFGADNRPPGSIPYIPPSTDEGREAYGIEGVDGKTSLEAAVESVADYGNRATDDYFGRFLPEMHQRNVNEAKATGRSVLKGIQDFTGKIPELGDPKELFEYYMGKID